MALGSLQCCKILAGAEAESEYLAGEGFNSKLTRLLAAFSSF